MSQACPDQTRPDQTGQWDKGTKGKSEKSEKRDKGTMGQRDNGTKG